MSRFDMDNEDGMPWGLWESVVSNALGGRRGQEALAALEAALIELPERKLIEGHLAAEGAVCAVGALVAHQRAQREGVDLDAVIDAMSVGVRCTCSHALDAHSDAGRCTGKLWQDRPCGCSEYYPDWDRSDIYDTAMAGKDAGLTWSVAWHLAYLNDEQFAEASPEERYDLVLAWVRRAQGKPVPEGTSA